MFVLDSVVVVICKHTINVYATFVKKVYSLFILISKYIPLNFDDSFTSRLI